MLMTIQFCSAQYCSVLHGRDAVDGRWGTFFQGVIDGNLDVGDAPAEDAELTGGTPGEVDDATTAEGSTVVDLDHHLLSVAGVDHPEPRAKGMRTVCTGETVVMQALATACHATRGPLAVVRGDALLCLADGHTK